MKTIGSSVPLSIVSIKHCFLKLLADIELHKVNTSAVVLQLGPASRTSEQTPLPTMQPDIMDAANSSSGAPLLEPEILRGHIPAGHIPKPVVIADYVA